MKGQRRESKNTSDSGIYYDEIPQEWVEQLRDKDVIEGSIFYFISHPGRVTAIQPAAEAANELFM